MCWALASFTHSHGFVLFALLLACELVGCIFKVAGGVLMVSYIDLQRMDTPVLWLKGLLYHVSAPLWLLAFKTRDVGLWLLVALGYYLAHIDIRTISIAQIALVLLASEPASKCKRKKLLIAFLIFQLILFFLTFVFSTWRFIVDPIPQPL